MPTASKAEPTALDALVARVEALEERLDLKHRLEALEQRTVELEQRLPDDFLIPNAQSLSGAGALEEAPPTGAAGAWVPHALNAAKVESAGLQVPGARAELFGNVGRFRGALKIKEATLANETLLTVEGPRPPATIEFERVTSAGKLLRCKITAAGVLSTTEALVAGEVLFFDSFTYNLT